MAFEQFRKTRSKLCMPPDEISVTKTAVFFGADFSTEIKKKGGYISIFFDRQDLRVGFKPVEKAEDMNSYKASESNNKYCIVPKSFLTAIPLGRYKTFRDNGMFIIRVTDIAIK